MKWLVDLFFPKICLGCGEWGAYICDECLNQCQPLRQAICPACLKLSMFGQTHARCKRAWRIDGLTSGFAYRGLIKQAIGKLKFKFVSDLNGDLVELVISMADLDTITRKRWLITPVPLHPRRERWRGFNQAHYLGDALGRYTGWDYESKLIERVKHTEPQTSLSGKHRRENLKEAFGYVGSKKGKGKRVLLVDDVFTTGATMRECAKVLKRNGAREVWGFVVARSLPKRQKALV